MKPFPIWSLPFLFVLVGLIALVGNLGTTMLLLVGAETLAFAAYTALRGYHGYPRGAPISDLLALFPGHLLVLLIVALSPNPDRLAALWAAIPLVSIAYDLVTVHMRNTTLGRSTLVSLYSILWADVFYLLERAISSKRQFSAGAGRTAAIAFGAAGAVFIALGVYRHWHASKE
jgi:hypothetical protein